MITNRNQKIYPYEFATWKILPAVKAELSRRMLEDGLKVKDICEILGATSSSVYQYLRRERGNNFDIPETMDPMFKTVIKMLKNDSSDDVLFYGVTQICNEIVRQHYGWDSLD